MARTCEAIKLTQRSVQTAQPQTDKKGAYAGQRLYFDTELPGFGLCVSAGTKTFFAQRSVQGRPVRVTIGRAEYFSVDQARVEAQQHLARMSRGENPNAIKRQQRAQGFTLREALELCEGTLKAKGRSEKTIDGYRYAIETYLADWLDQPLAEISREACRARHAKIAEDVRRGRWANGRKRQDRTGKATANAALVAFRAVYGRALREHPELPICPTINVDFFSSEKRKALPLAQLHKWHAKVAEIENAVRRDFLIFSLHTGLRRKSASEARWEHVSFEGRVLHVPNPKGGRAFDLPLTGFLISLLRERQQQNEKDFPDSPWIFPSAESESGHIAEPREEFDGLKWTIHDLRRWFIRVAESLDVSPYSIKLLVNHALPRGDVTAGYMEHELERLRPVMEMIGERLRTLCESPEGKVLPLARAKAKRKAGRS